MGSEEFQGGVELRPLSGTVKSDGQSLQLEALKGKIGSGEASGSLDARSSPNGIAVTWSFPVRRARRNAMSVYIKSPIRPPIAVKIGNGKIVGTRCCAAEATTSLRCCNK